MLRNKIGPSFDSENVFLFVFFFARFSLKSHSPCRKKKFLKNEKRKKQRKIGPSFDSKKAIFGPRFESTAILYICCEIIIWSEFGVFNSYYLAQVRGIIWSKVIFDLLFYCGFKRFFGSIIICVYLVPNYLAIF